MIFAKLKKLATPLNLVIFLAVVAIVSLAVYLLIPDSEENETKAPSVGPAPTPANFCRLETKCASEGSTYIRSESLVNKVKEIYGAEKILDGRSLIFKVVAKVSEEEARSLLNSVYGNMGEEWDKNAFTGGKKPVTALYVDDRSSSETSIAAMNLTTGGQSASSKCWVNGNNGYLIAGRETIEGGACDIDCPCLL